MRTETWVKQDNPTIEVEVVRLDEDNVEEAAAWCGGELVEEIDPEHTEEMQHGINFQSATGWQRGSLGMYLVKYGQSFYTSHNRPFEMNYMPKGGPAIQPESAGEAARSRGFGSYGRQI